VLRLIESFEVGTVGKEHTPPEDEGIIGKTDTPAKRTHALSLEEENVAQEPEGKPSDRIKKEKKGDRPTTVYGPKGQIRTLVKSDSLGISFSHEALLTVDKICVLDEVKGIVRFNIRHPLWGRCEEYSDRALMRFQEHVAIQTLVLHTMPKEWRAVQETFIEEALAPFVFHLLHRDTLAGRTPKTRPQETAIKTKTRIRKATSA